MIDDEVLNGQNSPPPPAPNGENSTEIFQPAMNQQRQFQEPQSWNPFCVPMIQKQESHQQLSSMNPFHADLMKQQVQITYTTYSCCLLQQPKMWFCV